MVTSKQELKRYLDPFEEAMYNAIGTTTLASEYQGHINFEALRTAFNILCIRHPVLRSRVRVDNFGRILEVRAEYFADIVMIPGGKKELFRETASLKKTLHPLMSQLLVVYNEERGYVVLALDHAIVDGHAAFVYIAELWEQYTALALNRVFDLPEPGDLPEGPSAALSRRWMKGDRGSAKKAFPPDRELPKEEGVMAGEGLKVSMVDDDSPYDLSFAGRLLSIRRELIELDSRELGQIVDASKSHGVTVSGILLGTLLATLRNQTSTEGRVPIKIAVAIDLRYSVEPPISPTGTTDLAANVAITIEVEKETDPVALGRQFSDKIRCAMNPRNFDHIVDSDASPDDVSRIHFGGLSDCYVVFNNSGRIPRLRTPPGLEVTNLLIDPGVDPSEEGEVVRRELPIPYSMTVYTLGDTLRIIWGEPDNSGISIKDRFLFELREITASNSQKAIDFYWRDRDKT